MVFEKLLNVSQKYNVSLEALAVLGTKLRADSEHLTINPNLAPFVDGVVAAMGFSRIRGLERTWQMSMTFVAGSRLE